MMPVKTGKAADGRGLWLKFTITTPPEFVEGLSNFLMELGAQGVFQEELDISPFTDAPEPPSRGVLNAFLPSNASDRSHISALTTYINSISEMFPELERPQVVTEVLVDPDWEEQWKKYFKPLRVTRSIVIKPTWERYQATSRDTVIDIDPGMAFGTGQHPSTRMCLQAMEDLILQDREARNRRVLDVGTGTGILGIAAAKLGAGKVVCVDIDKQAVAIAAENARMNGVEDRVDVLYQDAATLAETFDLIAANLTARMLIKLRPRLIDLLSRGGFLILSGIIEQNREDIEHHFLAEPFVAHRTIIEKEWRCYVLRNEGYR